MVRLPMRPGAARAGAGGRSSAIGPGGSNEQLMRKRTARPVSRLLLGAACAALTLQLAACGTAAGAKTHSKSAHTSSATAGGGSATSATSSTGSTAVTSGGKVMAFYFQGQPTHEAELIQLGLSAFPQVFHAASLQVTEQSIPTGPTLAKNLLGLVTADASPSSLFVCACPDLPATVAKASTQGYTLMSTEKGPSANFFYSVGPTSTPSGALQPLATALATIRQQALGKGQTFVTTFLEKHFGETPTHALQTYESLAGKPVLAAASDLTVDSVNFYPMLGWSHHSEYMTQVLTITNPTENSISGLSIPVPPGVTQVHAGGWGKTWPPFNGKPLAVAANGTVSISSPLPPLQTVKLRLTFRASSAAAKTWPTFTWTLPFNAAVVEVKLAQYYALQGDRVSGSLSALPVKQGFSIWGASQLAAGQTVTFRPFGPSHKVLG